MINVIIDVWGLIMQINETTHFVFELLQMKSGFTSQRLLIEWGWKIHKQGPLNDQSPAQRWRQGTHLRSDAGVIGRSSTSVHRKCWANKQRSEAVDRRRQEVQEGNRMKSQCLRGKPKTRVTGLKFIHWVPSNGTQTSCDGYTDPKPHISMLFSLA